MCFFRSDFFSILSCEPGHLSPRIVLITCDHIPGLVYQLDDISLQILYVIVHGIPVLHRQQASTFIIVEVHLCPVRTHFTQDPASIYDIACGLFSHCFAGPDPFCIISVNTGLITICDRCQSSSILPGQHPPFRIGQRIPDPVIGEGLSIFPLTPEPPIKPATPPIAVEIMRSCLLASTPL